MTSMIAFWISQLASRMPSAAMHGVRKIQSGRAAGLSLVCPRNADPRFEAGTYEMPIQDAIAEMLSPGDVFFDIGANLGFFSLVAARAVGPEGRVYAFEPVPRNADAIRRCRNINNLPWIDVFVEAVGASSGKADMWIAKHPGGSALASADTPPDRLRKANVDLVSLDDAIAERGLRPPNLIKIDVEGAEHEVLEGLAKTLLAANPALLCEVDDATEEGLDRKRRELSETLVRSGYRVRVLPLSYDASEWHVAHLLATWPA